MERTLLINFPASLRDVRNWHHFGDVAISADGRFAPEAVDLRIWPQPSTIREDYADR